MTYSLADVKVGDKITLEHKATGRGLSGAKVTDYAGEFVIVGMLAGRGRFYLGELIRDGWSITSIEKATPELPTEPGYYLPMDYESLPNVWMLTRFGEWLVLPNSVGARVTNLDTSLLGATPRARFTRLAPEAQTAEKVLERIAETFRDMSSDTRSRLAGIGTEFGVTS